MVTLFNTIGYGWSQGDGGSGNSDKRGRTVRPQGRVGEELDPPKDIVFL